LGASSPRPGCGRRCLSPSVAFDALALGPRGGDVEPLLELPLGERRKRLEALDLLAGEHGRFALSHLVTAEDADALECVFAEARARRNEGLMVKDPAKYLLAPAGAVTAG